MSADATVAQALDQARARGVAMLDARLMLGRLLGRTPTQLIAHDDERLGAEAAARWADWLARRAGGEPLAYLLGEKEFHGLLLEVTPEVLVPRPETELLVDWAGELLARLARPARGDRPRHRQRRDRPGRQASASRRGGDGHRRQRRCPRRRPAQRPAARARGRVRRDILVAGAGRSAIRHRPGQPALHRAKATPPWTPCATSRAAALTPGGDGLAALREIVAGARRAPGSRAAGCCSSTASTRPARSGRCSAAPGWRRSKRGATWPATRAPPAAGCPPAPPRGNRQRQP